MGVKRGDLVIVIAPGDYGKPRPALVVQSDLFRSTESVVLALITTEDSSKSLLFRKALQPSEENGLRKPSFVMLDKLVSLPRTKVSEPIGRLLPAEVAEASASLALFLGM